MAADFAASRRRSVTVKDVAERAGVSAMTVSRTLAGGGQVSEPLRDRVWEAVEVLGYARNENARSLRPGQGSGLIGVAITNIANPYYGEFALGVEDVASEHGTRILLGNTDEDQHREQQLIRDFLGRRVDGLIVVPAAGGRHEHLMRLATGQTPLVLASRRVAGIVAPAVVLDDVAGSRTATRELIAAGHQRIGFLGTSSTGYTTMQRLRGFSEAMARAGLEVDETIVHDDQHDVATAMAAARRLLAHARPPTAIFAANNRNAIGALSALRDSDCTVTIASFDDFELAHLTPVPLLVIEHDPREMGRRAASRLLGDDPRDASVDVLPVTPRWVRR